MKTSDNLWNPQIFYNSQAINRWLPNVMDILDVASIPELLSFAKEDLLVSFTHLIFSEKLH